jgi:hypothetical protein
MDSLEFFLDKHKDELKIANTIGSPEFQSTDDNSLCGILLSADESRIAIGHLGRKFLISREDVLSVDDAPPGTANTMGQGVPVLLRLKQTTTLLLETKIPFSQLSLGAPFALACPSQISPEPVSPYSDRELQWRSERGIETASPLAPVSFTTVWSPISSTVSSASYSGGRQDDSHGDAGFDGSRGDGYKGDD